MRTLINGDITPTAGDLVLATVQEIGKQRRIEKPSGRRAHLVPGDEIVLCYGSRYAPDQYEALISKDLGPCDLVATGGIASREISRHDRFYPPTRITPIGLVGNADGQRLNVADYRIAFEPTSYPMTVILVAGTAMNSGKTYTAASIVRSLKAYGYRVAGIKVTGTGSGGDVWQMKDMGADLVLDFTDGGFASTYLEPNPAIEEASIGLINYAARRKCDFSVVEIADGLKQRETAALLHSSTLKARSSGLVFAAYDSMGAKAGYDHLITLGYNVLAISGQVTRSPLAMRETTVEVDCPIVKPTEIQEGALISEIHRIRNYYEYQNGNTCAQNKTPCASNIRPALEPLSAHSSAIADNGGCGAFAYANYMENEDEEGQDSHASF
jgi:hypothetical protein